MNLEEFYLAFQPIVIAQDCHNKLARVDEYEILLRSSRTNAFPIEEFKTILSNKESYETFIKWFYTELEQQIQKYPELHFSINLDIDQFQYDATFQFLQQIADYSNHIIIEITEHRPTRMPDLLDKLQTILEKIKLFAFDIAIDDFTEEINTYQLYNKHRDYYNRIKITYKNHKSFFNILFLALYVKWLNRLYDKQISIVVERIDSLKKAKIIKCLGISHQQGYFWAAGRRHIKDKET